jgi:oligopeptidase A
VENPLLLLDKELAFDRILAEHVGPGLGELIRRTQAALDAIEASEATPGYDTTLGALEHATEELELAVAIVEHLESVATTPAYRDAYNEALPEVTALFAGIPLRQRLFRRLLAFSETNEATELDATHARFLEKTLADFRRHGAMLDDAGKEKLRAIDRELVLLTNKFAQNVLDDTNAFELVVDDVTRLRGLPESALDAARDAANAKGQTGYRLTLQAPSVTAVLTYADDTRLREMIWRAYNGRALANQRDNQPLIAKILELRREKATLLGFRHFADLVTEERMAKTGAQAHAFVEDLTRKSEASFEREKQELLAFRRELEGDDAPGLAPWDLGYYSEKLKKARYSFDDEELRPYFSFERVLEGAFGLAERLFGVSIQPNSDTRTWDPSVRAFVMRDADGRDLGLFWVDPFPRENKRGGAWMHGFLTAVPPARHAAVFCANVQPPAGGKPSLLTHRDVETIFHEFGHLLHHCLSTVNVRSLGGTRVVQDFVELPSQIMENWCTEREGLDLFARHYESGLPIPSALLDRLRAARTYRAATLQMRQLGFAAVDLALHMEYDPARHGDAVSYGNRILQRFVPAPLPADYGILASFLHLFSHPVGYAAGYYSYKWAEVLDADAFERFKSEGVLDPRVGRDFRERLLSQGDSRDPMDLYRNFRGREPRVEALLERQGLA